MTTVYEWRGTFTNQEVNTLHAEAFNTRVFDESEWNWVDGCQAPLDVRHRGVT